MSDGSYDGLRARVDMDVLDNNPLLSASTQLTQRVHLRGKGFCQASDGKSIGILLLDFVAPVEVAECAHSECVRYSHLADQHCFKLVLGSLSANDGNHGIQFGRIDCAISLAECLGDTFHFNMGNGLARRAKGRHELGAPAVYVRMPWALENLSCAIFRLDLRADLKAGRHFRNGLPSRSDGALLGIVWLSHRRWHRVSHALAG
jgi:hypothetical protein